MKTKSKFLHGISTIVMLGLKIAGIDLRPQILQRCQGEKETTKCFVISIDVLPSYQPEGNVPGTRTSYSLSGKA